MFSWFSSNTNKEVEDKCAPNLDQMSKDVENLLWDGARETAEETAKDLFGEKPNEGVVDSFNKIDSVGGFFNKGIDNVINYFNATVDKERMCRKEEEEAKEPVMPEPEPEPEPAPAPAPSVWAYSGGQWVGPNGVVQDWYGGGCPGNDGNGNDSGPSGATGCHTDSSGQCKPDTSYSLNF